jgi:hypothetical protein
LIGRYLVVSFDLYLFRFKAGEGATADKKVVLSLLQQHCKDGCDKFATYSATLPDNSHIEVRAKGLESDETFSSCFCSLRSFSPAVIRFVYDIAKAADLVIFNAQGMADDASNPMVILTEEAQARELPKDVGSHPALCSSPEHLGQLLGIGIGTWAGYRDQVVEAHR